MIISCLYPSRGRAKKCHDNVIEWQIKSNASVEIIVATDSDDPQQSEYQRLFKHTNILTHNNKSVVEATNRAASVASGKIFVYMSDDFKCPDNWGELIMNEFQSGWGLSEFKTWGDVTEKPRLLKVDDCLQPFTTAVLTIPIMNRALYDKLGYFWHPEYKSMFVDEDLYWTAFKLNALKLAPHLKFPHEHHSLGKCANDETYRRSEANWNQGKAVFAKRKAAGFPI